jgi:UDP-N-acetylmuramyl pentapeptide phosphotransferase/UDP-N-acetylglucosamine-1-phosphate transferase
MPIGLWIGEPGPVVRFALAGAMMAMIGFFEDLRTLPRLLRITAQIIAALIFVPDVPISVIGLPRMELIIPPPLDVILALVWVVGLSTIYTYMDNVDGLAGGQAALVGLLWAYIGLTEGKSLVALLALLIVGATIGFLYHNLSAHKIYMGEVGSTFIGFSLAALPLLMQHESSRLIVSGALFVALFAFDALLTITIYVVRGRYMQQPNRSHLYQRMLRLGDPPLRVLALYLLISIGFCVAGLIYYREPAWLALLIVVLCCIALFIWVKRRESAPIAQTPTHPANTI